MAAALEAASAGLTADARDRLRTGPLADARRSRDAAVGAARAAYLRRVEEAVRGYGPAGPVFDSVKETLRALHTELMAYEVVLEAAEVAAADAGTAADAAGRAAAVNAVGFGDLEARAESAKAAFERAERAYEQAVGRRPGRIEPRKTGGENFGRFLEGLNSLAAGDEEGAERLAEEMGRARAAALSEAEAANAAAGSAYATAVARARAARDAARAAYRTASAAAQRAAADAVNARAERESASEDYEAAFAARRASFVSAARVTRVYEAVEMEEVERALIAGALSAIGELEAETLARITTDAALQAVEAALRAYAEPRLAYLRPLENLEVEHSAAAEGARTARVALETAQVNNERRVAGAINILERIESSYLRSVNFADRALENVLVSSFRRTKPLDRKGVAMRTDAAAAHERAMEAARLSRRQAVARSFPGLNVRDSQYPELSAMGSGWSSGVVSSVSRYKRNRSAADTRYREAILAALSTNTARLAAKARSTAAARDAARGAYDAAIATAQAATAFDEKARARLRTLEADVHLGIVAAGRASLQEAPVELEEGTSELGL